MGQDRQIISAYDASNFLPHLAAFLAVVEAGSFTAAGRRAGVDKTQLSRRVSALEDGLQVRLLNRTTRRMHLTEAGRALLDASTSPVLEVLQALQLAASPDHVQGTVRVASIPETAVEIWAPVVKDLARSHPAIHLDITAGETMVSVVDSGVDLAVRIGHMPDSSLIMRRLASWRYVLVASPTWVAAHPEVQAPEDLVPHWVLYGDVTRADRWRFERDGSKTEVTLDSVFTTDSGLLQRAALVAGVGVSAMAPFAVGEALRSGMLVRVLPQWRVAHTLGIFGVTPHRAYVPARVEVVLNAVRAQVRRREPLWEALTD